MSLFPNIRKRELSDSSAFKSHPQSVGVGSLPRPTVLDPSRTWHGAGGCSLAGPTAPRPLGGTRSSALLYCPSLRPTVHLKEWVDFFLSWNSFAPASPCYRQEPWGWWLRVYGYVWWDQCPWPAVPQVCSRGLSPDCGGVGGGQGRSCCHPSPPHSQPIRASILWGLPSSYLGCSYERHQGGWRWGLRGLLCEAGLRPTKTHPWGGRGDTECPQTRLLFSVSLGSAFIPDGS